MNRKKAFYVLVISVILISTLIYCVLQNASSKGKACVFSREKFSINNCEIYYPKLESQKFNLDSEEFLKQYFRYNYENFPEDLCIKCDFEIQYFNKNYISILFYGTSYTETSAHPTNIAFTYNYNLLTCEAITYTDFSKTKNIFVDEVFNALSKQSDNNITEYFKQFSKKDIEALLINCDSAQGNAFTYLTSSEKCFIILTVPHVLGDYVIMGIDLSDQSGSSNQGKENLSEEGLKPLENSD